MAAVNTPRWVKIVVTGFAGTVAAGFVVMAAAVFIADPAVSSTVRAVGFWMMAAPCLLLFPIYLFLPKGSFRFSDRNWPT